MKKKQKLSRKQLGVIIAICIVVIAALGGAYYMKKIGWFGRTNQVQPTQTINYGTPTSDEKSTGDTIKNSNTPSQDSPSTSSGSQNGSNSNTSIPVTITAATVNNSLFQVRILIETSSSTGSCALSMSGPSGKTYSASAGTQVGPSTSTCKGFDVPTTSLSSGRWKVTVTFNDGTTSGSASTEVTIP